ncbi:arginine--tRNA ligase [Mariniblastus fucicola]|uniref:Arginine--tRNA ligase n=1 Tax=Mariniblastus fucicola TaxID=980251 RepID=A0A5B9P499_9BACT|nr:arginine--tRNA ligase [Mariniblastus fucicola]QEG21228.1 Arginine--tRNA ligase [Mariniblastus fucicola]
MNALAEIRTRFADALVSLVDDPTELLGMIRPAKDATFGDYQANLAMPLGKKLGKPPRDMATEIVEKLAVDGLCSNVDVAGPGFINLKLDDEWLKGSLSAALVDERLGVSKVADPKTYVVDFSSPNVAKPMHVGHIRSTVIGDAISKILSFAGHKVITDNHVGDWGTQFGMIIYGYKHFLDAAAYEKDPVTELGRLYKFVRQLVDYHAAKGKVDDVADKIIELSGQVAALKEKQAAATEKAETKKIKKELSAVTKRLDSQKETGDGLKAKIDAIESNPDLIGIANAHPEIGQQVLLETAKLHEGDKENKELWTEFLPYCWEDMRKIYRRLNIEHDHELGESFYHDMLGDVVSDFEAKGFARTSDGAVCVFMDDYETPMIIRKKDGAFLYSTTDLATIKYRVDHFGADAALCVVDHRQHEHFDKLFDAARLWGYKDIELTHVSFGTVLGDDGKPFKTRSGDTVGLESLLDEAESRALAIAVEQNPDLSEEQQKHIATTVGIGALKYADLSQNRGSDYKFSYDKMLATRGNTATYLQFSYARVQGIIRKTGADMAKVRANPVPFEFATDIERELAVKLARFGETIDEVLVEYKPNLLCGYLFDLTQVFFQFLEKCSVKDAETESLKQSRLQFCDLMSRTVERGLGLLGIGVIEQM